MGMKMGSWVAVRTPNERKYPFKIAAKMAASVKSITQEEASQMITDTRYFYDKYRDQITTISELKKELAIAEHTVRLLQVEDS